MLDQVAKSNITKWSIQGHMMFKLVWCSTIPVFLKWKLKFVTSPWCTPLWVFSISEQEWQWRVKETVSGSFLTHVLRCVHKKNTVWVILCYAFGFLLSQLLFLFALAVYSERRLPQDHQGDQKVSLILVPVTRFHSTLWISCCVVCSESALHSNSPKMGGQNAGQTSTFVFVVLE